MNGFGKERELAEKLRLAIGKFKRRLREQTEIGELSWSQIAVLSRLDREGPSTVTALAKAEAMRPQSMGAIVAELEISKLIVGASNPKDGRQTIFQLTEAGNETLNRGRESGNDWLAQLLESELEPKEREILAASIDIIDRIVNSSNP